VDVRDPKQVKAFVDATVTKYGRLDIAFNNAGVSDPHKEIQDLEIETYLDTMLTNAGGTWFAMKYEIPHMRQQGSGVIINMASVAGHRGFRSTLTTSKHAVIGMTKSVAVVNAQHNIRVNSISPLAVNYAPTQSPPRASPTSRLRHRSSRPNHEHGRDGARRHVLASDEGRRPHGLGRDWWV